MCPLGSEQTSSKRFLLPLLNCFIPMAPVTRGAWNYCHTHTGTHSFPSDRPRTRSMSPFMCVLHLQQARSVNQWSVTANERMCFGWLAKGTHLPCPRKCYVRPRERQKLVEGSDKRIEKSPPRQLAFCLGCVGYSGQLQCSDCCSSPRERERFYRSVKLDSLD